MPWSQEMDPGAMSGLDAPTRTKAMAILDALLDEGYAESAALMIAISQAKKWAQGGNINDAYHVMPHTQGWAVRRDGIEQTSSLFETQEEARNRALELARGEGLNVIFYLEDGSVGSHADLIDEVEKEAYDEQPETDEQS
ncbi:MAG: DUF2188 domain-containing protein [Anaerolineae bacterium]|nr:DUF2188 domain-containing protein [Anaerolineae bacterium]